MVALVEKQVGVMGAVGRQNFGEGDAKNRLGLTNVFERGDTPGMQPLQATGQPGMQCVPWPVGAMVGEPGAGVAEVALPARIRPTVGKIQVAEQVGGIGRPVQPGESFLHSALLVWRQPRKKAAPCSIAARHSGI